MRKELISFTLSLLISTQSFAKCKNPVTILEQGVPAPCSGYLFSPDKELEVRLKIEENGLLQKQIELKDLTITNLYKDAIKSSQIVELEEKKAELWRTRAEESTKKLVESENGKSGRELLFFILGMAATVGAGLAIGAASK